MASVPRKSSSESESSDAGEPRATDLPSTSGVTLALHSPVPTRFASDKDARGAWGGWWSNLRTHAGAAAADSMKPERQHKSKRKVTRRWGCARFPRMHHTCM